MTYSITTDAASEELDAETADDAARQFAAGEGLAATTLAELRQEIEAAGGWLYCHLPDGSLA